MSKVPIPHEIRAAAHTIATWALEYLFDWLDKDDHD